MQVEPDDGWERRVKPAFDAAERADPKWKAITEQATAQLEHGKSLLRRLDVCDGLNLDGDQFWTACYRAARYLGFSESEFDLLPPFAIFRVLEARLNASSGEGDKLSTYARRRLGITGGRTPDGIDCDGDKLRALRGNTSQVVFARLCGKISPDTLQRAEAGRATTKTLSRIVKYLKAKGLTITVHDLTKNQPQKTART